MFSQIRHLVFIPMILLVFQAKSETLKEKNEDPIFQFVEVLPQFPGGDEALMKYLQENLDYPEEALKKNIQGTVFVTFIVERDGSLSDIEIMRGIGGGCDEEVIRVVKNMPNWIPGKHEEKEVRAQFTMPVRFTLLDNEEPSTPETPSPSASEEILNTVNVDSPPEFPGGEEGRMRFLVNNLRYPEAARKAGIQGTVFAEFVVERDGSISNVRIVRDIGGGCGEEVLRVVKSMPNWIPGKIDGKPVRVQFVMPMRFLLGPMDPPSPPSPPPARRSRR